MKDFEILKPSNIYPDAILHDPTLLSLTLHENELLLYAKESRYYDKFCIYEG